MWYCFYKTIIDHVAFDSLMVFYLDHVVCKLMIQKKRVCDYEENIPDNKSQPITRTTCELASIM